MSRNRFAAVALLSLATIFASSARAQDAEDSKPEAGKIIKHYYYDTNGDGTADENDPHVADERPEFRMWITTSEEGVLREVDIDADTMVAVELKDGKTVLAPSVAFISLFDILNSVSMSGLSAVEKELILQARHNKSLDRKQVSFMVLHVKNAHGVEYLMLKIAAKECEKYFPELSGP